jgi:hypothetical protein
MGWKTTDEQEREARRLRAGNQGLRVAPAGGDRAAWYGDFRVASGSVAQHAYVVQLRSLASDFNTCECPDFAKNGLGRCKHIEAVLAHLQRRGRRALAAAAQAGSPMVEVGVGRNLLGEPTVRVAWPSGVPAGVRRRISPFFSESGDLLADPADSVPAIQRELLRMPLPDRRRVRLGFDAVALANRARVRRERDADRAAWLADVAAGKRSDALVRNASLLDYQRDGAMHLAFTGRAMLADEMGLGKTIQAIAACSLLHRLGRARRVLVVAPASLKSEWREQIDRFTDLPCSILSGPRAARLRAYGGATFFTLANYEQIVVDWREINTVLRPDVVVLDEAQRIKNWKTRTASNIKRLAAPCAFVLTGTPVENRIDEVYSIAEFLDPAIFGSLFRFNRDFYELDDRGKPVAVRNLDELQRRLAPIMLRRRKADVEESLPPRTQKNYFVPMDAEQRQRYGEYEEQAARLAALAARRPLLPKEMEKLQLLLSCMRMLCDTPFILDVNCRVCPKLDELDELLDEILSEPDTKVIVFSEWVRMLDLVRERLDGHAIGYALHTGSIPQAKRRAEIDRFKADRACRLFLSSDSGATGLNLQCANVVINLDLPWNPAKLEQRIARAWRKNQTRPVRVVNLVTEDSIESRMLATLDLKRDIARGALDDPSLKRIDLNRNREDKLRRLNELLGRDGGASPASAPPRPPGRAARPADPGKAFGGDLAARLGARLARVERITPPQPGAAAILLAVVDDGSPDARKIADDVLAANYADAAGTKPELEVLDAAAVDLLRRLAAAGLIQPGPALREVLASRPDSGEAVVELRRRRAAEIDRLRAAADRSVAMAELLGANGFAAESVPPWREAFGLLLRALRLSGRPLEEADGDDAGPAGTEAALLLQRLAAADAADLEAFARLHEGPDTPQPAVLSGLARKIGSCLASGRPELD